MEGKLNGSFYGLGEKMIFCLELLFLCRWGLNNGLGQDDVFLCIGGGEEEDS